MYGYCKHEYDWLMSLIKRNILKSWEEVDNFICKDYLELRYMRKRFGYVFPNYCKYMERINRKYAIVVLKS